MAKGTVFDDFHTALVFCLGAACLMLSRSSLPTLCNQTVIRSLWCFVAGRRNFSDFIAGYVEPIKARYIGVNTGKDLGECSNLAAVTWGQRAAIGGLPHRLTSPCMQAVHLVQDNALIVDLVRFTICKLLMLGSFNVTCIWCSRSCASH
jgi:hypothetical protein